MKIIIAALLGAGLIQLAPTGDSRLNNLQTVAVVTKQPSNQTPARDMAQEKSLEQEKPGKPVEAPAPQSPTSDPESPEPVAAPVQAPVPTTHEALMAAAGISPEDYGAVDYIVSHESSWNENATEPTTGAHGLPQALPYSKTNCGWSDAVCQLSWANTYAVSRYGGWWPAYDYWVAHRNW